MRTSELKCTSKYRAEEEDGRPGRDIGVVRKVHLEETLRKEDQVRLDGIYDAQSRGNRDRLIARISVTVLEVDIRS